MIYRFVGFMLLLWPMVGWAFLTHGFTRPFPLRTKRTISSYLTITGGVLISLGLILHGMHGSAMIIMIGAWVYVAGLMIFLVRRKRAAT